MITRFIQSGDVGHWLPFVASAEATVFFPDYYAPDDSYHAAERFLSKQFIRYQEKRYGLQALLLKDTNEFIGLAGILAQVLDGEEVIEIGYHILPKYWGRGYATEAAALFIDYVKAKHISTAIVSIIDVDNHASIRVAEKNGLQRYKQTKYQGLTVWIYRKEIK
jgi:[ribosomal protein S5]-alanine N-acetyltransferase